jgi:dinuclear metal center YbgI/SA1388 family protein
MILRDELAEVCAQWLSVEQIQDYCPNGLQVEGKVEIRKLATSVTASLAAIEAAIEWGADALLVHHGYFWRNEPVAIVGAKASRIRRLIQSDINLFSYHLPLDMHSELGNNAELAKLWNLVDDGSDVKRVWRTGVLDFALPIDGFVERIRRTLRREPLVIAAGPQKVNRVAWCSGGAQSYFAQAIEQGIDAFITGEASEQSYHQALEAGVHFIAAGHHATERYGVQALGRKLAETYALEHRYIELANPI